MKKILTVTALVLFAFLVVREGTAQANYRVLHHFDGWDGSAPYGHLISVGGRLYGMTAGDSIRNTGMVFSIAPDGSDYTLLHHFAGQPTDGQWPHGSLFFQDDTLYGITWAGGCGGGVCPNRDNTGCGTLFSHKTDGSDYNVFWEFACGGEDDYASLPNAHFISDGNRLYSTASTGSSSGGESGGAVFAVQPDGTGFTLLHSFEEFNVEDGFQPGAGLVLEDGVLYGTTFFGGEYGEHGLGTVFSIRTDGSDFTTLHHFSGHPDDGESCGSTPILAYGRLYGVTMDGGAYNNGVIFSMRLDGSDYQVLHHFTGEDSGPMEGVIMVEGRLYGATTPGGFGTGTNGVIYSLGMDGSDYKVLHRFTYPEGDDGYWVDGRLLLAGDTLYGLASHGGNTGHGVIFALEESDLSPTVVIDGCDSEVTNILLPTGCSLSDEIAMCAASAENHGKFVSCVSHMTNDLKKDGIITGKEKGAIQSCAAQANIP